MFYLLEWHIYQGAMPTLMVENLKAIEFISFIQYFDS